jgi:phosphoribosyl-AMP cyclohydrolase
MPARRRGFFCFMDYSKLDDLIPDVIQDAQGSEVLMVGFMNEQALARHQTDQLRHVLQPHARSVVDKGRDAP